MTEQSFLTLFRELVQDAYIAKTHPDDASGCNTRYYVDQEQLLRNIEAKLEKLDIEEPKEVAPRE